MEGKSEWGSDVVVEMMQAYGIRYAPTNLGGTFRGLLDSILNFGGNQTPEVIECLHEEIAVSIANGYAKASGLPAVALVHNVVGTLHASMAIYDAYVAHSPVIVMSGTGPMRLSERRPWIDWVHTALVQGNLVRDYVKWDDQPHDSESFPESFMRAHRMAVTEPRGPVYIALDADWQEEKLTPPITLPDVAKYPAPSPLQADPAAIRETARLLASAELPMLVADRVGRNAAAVQSLVELAEVGSIPVIDAGGAFNFPNTHPLDATGTDLLSHADVVVMLDVDHLDQLLLERDRYPRGGGKDRLKAGAKLINIGVSDLWIRSTMTDYGRLYPVDLAVAADTSLAIPALTAELRQVLGGDGQATQLAARKAAVEQARDAARKRWQAQLEREREEKPISMARLTQEIWSCIQGEKWIVAGAAGGWTRRLWRMDRPGCMLGGGGAAALGSGLPKAIGVGLAARDQGGFCVAFNGDGDYMYVPSAIWTAVHHHIPVLLFVLDNGGYIGEGGHVVYTAEQRDRSTANKHICVEFQNPAIDFAGMARAQGAYAEGPIEDPAALGPAIQRAFKVMKEQSTMAVVDVRVG